MRDAKDSREGGRKNAERYVFLTLYCLLFVIMLCYWLSLSDMHTSYCLSATFKAATHAIAVRELLYRHGLSRRRQAVKARSSNLELVRFH